MASSAERENDSRRNARGMLMILDERTLRGSSTSNACGNPDAAFVVDVSKDAISGLGSSLG